MTVSGVHVRASVHVTARTYVFLVNEINRVFLEAITNGGLDPSDFATDQGVIENGLRTWMTLRQLEVAHLEVYDPRSGEVKTRIDLNIEFRDTGDEFYHTDIERVRGELSKSGQFVGCQYRVVVTTTPNAAVIKGWGETTLRNVDHLARHLIGEVIGAQRAGASLSILR